MLKMENNEQQQNSEYLKIKLAMQNQNKINREIAIINKNESYAETLLNTL